MIVISSGHMKPIPGELDVTDAIREHVKKWLLESGRRVGHIPTDAKPRGRVDVAHSYGAELYISLECSADPRGAWTLVDGATISAPRPTPSEEIAQSIFNCFSDMVPVRLRGYVHNRNDFLSKHLDCSNVVINCGYLTNRADADVLTSYDGQRRIAAAIVAGVTPWVS